jgi:hypothetical protein
MRLRVLYDAAAPAGVYCTGVAVARVRRAHRHGLGAIALALLVGGCTAIPDGVPSDAPAPTTATASPQHASPTAAPTSSADAPANPLVGTWEEVPPPPEADGADRGAKPHDPVLTAYRFWPDGGYEYVRRERRPAPKVIRFEGIYRIDGNVLRLRADGENAGAGEEMAYEMTFTGDRLVLTLVGATVSRTYVRVET